jgi:cytoskeletal protein CcmA (bactofilin family)
VDASNFSKDVQIVGEIAGVEDVSFDGTLKGSVHLPQHRFALGVNGRANANILARQIVVAGAVEGELRASELIELRSSARFTGKLQCRRLSIEDGAQVVGAVETVREQVKSKQEPDTAQLAISLS